MTIKISEIGNERKDLLGDFLLRSQSRFDNFISELECESDRGAAIFSGTFFEHKLKEILLEHLNKVKSTTTLLEEANGGLNTLSAKINICYSLGYITENEYNALNHLKKIRNQFAHNFDYKFSFDNKAVSSLCITLKNEFAELKGSKTENSRNTFINAIILLHKQLIDRHYEIMTFAPPAFSIGKYLDDPDAYRNVGNVERDFPESNKNQNAEDKYPVK